MKQMTLFDSFKKKGSMPANQEEKANQLFIGKTEEKIKDMPNENVDYNKQVRTVASVKKNTKLTLDSDE